jgi:hypothetical protein
MQRSHTRQVFIVSIALMALAAFLLAGCRGGGSRTYPVDLPDEDHDLPAMQVSENDMPFEGMQLAIADSFTNEEWARAFATQNPLLDYEQKVIQLDAQGRVLGHLALFSWPDPTRNLGKILQVESHAIIYRDEEAASNAISLRACGLLIGDDRPLEPFDVPRVADESAGFFHRSDFGMLGTAVDTIVCFRTGRLVHAVVQNGLDGTQNIERAVEMAQRKLQYVDAAFDGTDPPERDQS